MNERIQLTVYKLMGWATPAQLARLQELQDPSARDREAALDRVEYEVDSVSAKLQAIIRAKLAGETVRDSDIDDTQHQVNAIEAELSAIRANPERPILPYVVLPYTVVGSMTVTPSDPRYNGHETWTFHGKPKETK